MRVAFASGTLAVSLGRCGPEVVCPTPCFTIYHVTRDLWAALLSSALMPEALTVHLKLCILIYVCFLTFFLPGQLLFPPQNVVALVLCCLGGCIYSTFHQSLWQQPPGSVLCGVSHPLASLGARALHSAGHIWWSVGSFVYPHQHCLVSEA